MFDAEAFQNMVINQPNSTTSVPWPPGQYPVTIAKVNVRTGTVQKAGPNQGKPWASLSIMVEADRSVLPEGASSVAYGSIMLDLTESGGLDLAPGKNVGLGRLREAVGLNRPGQPFRFSDLEGRSCVVVTDVRVDNNDPNVSYTDVRAFRASA